MHSEKHLDPHLSGLRVEEIIPLGVVEVGRDDRGAFGVSLVHQLEESIGLFGLEIPKAVQNPGQPALLGVVERRMASSGRRSGILRGIALPGFRRVHNSVCWLTTITDEHPACAQVLCAEGGIESHGSAALLECGASSFGRYVCHRKINRSSATPHCYEDLGL
jgi:hypothetical protein